MRQFLIGEFPQASIREAEAGTLFEIAEIHPAVGPLTIQFDSDEITVFVGPTHCHFETFGNTERQSEAIHAAIEFIREVLSDRIVLWSCLGAGGTYPIEEKARRRVPWPVRRYVWSGPIA